MYWRQLLATLCVISGLALVAPVTWAAEGEAPAAEVQAKEASGTIAKVDAESHAFTLKTETEEMALKVDDKTKYFIEGKEVTRDDALKEGTKAMVKYAEGVAQRIDVTG